MTDTEKTKRLIDAALQLIEGVEGNIELARSLWNDLFEEAERLDYNQSNYDEDEWERAIREQAERFDKAVEERRKFHVIKSAG